LLVLALWCSHRPIASAQEAAAAAEAAHPQGDSLITLFIQGGWVMYPILVCSIAMVWLTVDTWGRTGLKKIAPPAQVAQMQDLFRSGDYVGAYQFCKGNNSAFTDVNPRRLSFLVTVTKPWKPRCLPNQQGQRRHPDPHQLPFRYRCVYSR
jgi:biopolymer transport protein ExbB